MYVYKYKYAWFLLHVTWKLLYLPLLCAHMLTDTGTNTFSQHENWKKNLFRKVFEVQSTTVVFWTYCLVNLWTKGFAALWLSEAIQSISETLQLQENKTEQNQKNQKEDASSHILGQHWCSCRAVFTQLLVRLASKWKKTTVSSLLKTFEIKTIVFLRH